MVCENPIVLFGPELKVRQHVSELAHRKLQVHYLSYLTWSRRSWSRVIKAGVTTWQDRGVTTHHVCNEATEYRRFRSLGLRAMYANHNLMLAENIFQPMPTLPKRFHAVYNAHVWPYKRVGLASKIDSLRLITATEAKWHERIIEQRCEHADVNKTPLTPKEVTEALNECYCGLALSAEEGTMRACTEYLLCGLPVVSTPSLGGRDVWFDDYNSIIVEPNPEAVATAVQRLVAEGRDPQRIRAGTLERMQQFRQTMIDYVNKKIAKTKVVSVIELFGDGMGMASRFVEIKDLREFLESYHNGRFQARRLIGAD